MYVIERLVLVQGCMMFGREHCYIESMDIEYTLFFIQFENGSLTAIRLDQICQLDMVSAGNI